MGNSINVTHEGEGHSSGVSMPVGKNGTYISLIEIKNGIVHNPILTFIDKESFDEIKEVVSRYDKFVNSELTKCVANYENKRIGLFDNDVKYKVEQVDILELEGYVPSNQFIGLVEDDGKEITYTCSSYTMMASKIKKSKCE